MPQPAVPERMPKISELPGGPASEATRPLQRGKGAFTPLPSRSDAPLATLYQGKGAIRPLDSKAKAPSARAGTGQPHAPLARRMTGTRVNYEPRCQEAR